MNKGLSFSLHPSPNFNERRASVLLEYVVLHYTGSKKGDEEWLDAVGNPAVELSAHYLVRENGTIVRVIEESQRAWHAGVSYWRGVTDMNSASIGIELANPGHPYGYRPFPAVQIAALTELLFDIVERNGLNAQTCLLAHSDIAPTRKQDPGELFPWKGLAQAGLGLWPEPGPDDYRDCEQREIVRLLQTIGYFCENDSSLESPVARAALLAFQRRYYPEGLTGEPDGETIARLRALTRLLAK